MDPFLQAAIEEAKKGRAAGGIPIGSVLVCDGKIIGRGWHRRAGLPHAEIEAIDDAQKRGHNPRGATLYVTLEPCSTHGRTPPCTDAIIAAGIKRVVIGAVDPNPKHAGRAFKLLRRAGIEAESFGVPRLRGKDNVSRSDRLKAELQTLSAGCQQLNEAFNHWIVHGTPLVTVKAAMTLDGKIATADRESKWITGEKARAYAMQLRQGTDAVLVGINTILADDPSLTARKKMADGRWKTVKPIRRIVLDSKARTPLKAKVVTDKFAPLTTIVVGTGAPRHRVTALAKRVKVITAPTTTVGRAYSRAGSSKAWPRAQTDLAWLLKKLGSENVTSLLVEGGGEVNASFLLGGFAGRVAFFYAPKILGGRDSLKAVAGQGARSLAQAVQLRDVEWKRLGRDLLLTAQVAP